MALAWATWVTASGFSPWPRPHADDGLLPASPVKVIDLEGHGPLAAALRREHARRTIPWTPHTPRALMLELRFSLPAPLGLRKASWT